MTKKRNYTRYTEKYKLSVLEYTKEFGVVKASKDYGLPTKTILRWNDIFHIYEKQIMRTFSDETKKEVLKEFLEVKNTRKEILVNFIKERNDIDVDINSIFDIQVKRLHAYKRQLLNCLHIIYLYQQLKDNPNFKMYPHTFIFGAKAAPSYVFAKNVIELINCMANKINNDPEVNKFIKVVFIENYDVSTSEVLMPGADVSEQISLAGKEASGTGNMKFMMNGAPTIGTLDGANIEIVQEAGTKNNYIFGATVDELKRIKPIYRHQEFLNANRDLVDLLGYLKGEKNLKGVYWDLVNTLLYDDRYFNMYDLRSYIEITLKANYDYTMEQETGDLYYYTRKSLKNTAHVGKFSSDRTIQEYSEEIWDIEKV
mgnify:CR=1 FL=1